MSKIVSMLPETEDLRSLLAEIDVEADRKATAEHRKEAAGRLAWDIKKRAGDEIERARLAVVAPAVKQLNIVLNPRGYYLSQSPAFMTENERGRTGGLGIHLDTASDITKGTLGILGILPTESGTISVRSDKKGMPVQDVQSDYLEPANLRAEIEAFVVRSIRMHRAKSA